MGEAERPGAQDATEAFAAAFFDELAQAGVEHVCVSPGSRSTPLVVAAYRARGLRCTAHIDERAAGFFALGLARVSGHPVALVCTSGTAAANYAPAVAEAHLSRVPLIVLTADRPPELRDCGAGQTIDQIGLYGRHVRRFAEVPVAVPGAAMLRFARSLAARTVADATGRPPGPVHLNWPLREPLEPHLHEGAGPPDPAPKTGDELADEGRFGLPYTTQVQGESRADAGLLRQLRDRVRRHERGLIVCGPMPPDEARSAAIVELGRRAGWPIVADPLSQLRGGPHVAEAPVLANAEFVLRDAEFAKAHRPEVVVRFGAPPVSKALRLWLEAAPPDAHWLVDPDGGWEDPSHLASRVLRLDPAPLCREWAEGLDDEARTSRWLRDFVAADRRSGDAVARALDGDAAVLGPRAVRELSQLLPDDAWLYVSNSMAVRLVDSFWPLGERRVRMVCNRGANGIDGVVSSALGGAAANRGPVVLLIGDIAMLHDLSGLLAARRHALDLTIVLINDDGGGIFSFLPIAAHGESVGFEALYRTPHGIDFAPAAALFGLEHTRVESWAAYRAAVADSLARPGVTLVELRVDAEASVRHFRALAALAGQALAGDPE